MVAESEAALRFKGLPEETLAESRKTRARAEKRDVEHLEEVELSQYKRNLIRGGPGQNELDGCKMPDACLDKDAAGFDMRKRTR